MLARVVPVLFATALAAQQEIWVDPVGGADTDPGTYALPLRTFGAAVFQAGPGDRIHLLPGVYGTATNGESFPIHLGQQPQVGVVVRGIGEVVFDLGGATSTALLLSSGADGARLTNLTFRNSAQTNTQGGNWWTRVVNSGSGVNSGNAAAGVEIDRCRFEQVNRVFVFWTADNTTGWLVHDNLFVDCANDAILEYSGDNQFYNNTFHTGGFKAYISDSPTSTFRDNLIVDYAIGFENNNGASTPTGRIESNWLHQCATVTQGIGFTTPLPASNQVGIDPQLANPTGGDFHLRSTSPCIDAGMAGAFLRADLDANSRLVDGDNDGQMSVDVGCYEYTPLSMTASYDPLTTLVQVDALSTLPGSFGIVAFSLDDGIVQLPGQGPILVDLATWIPFLWVTATPGQLFFPVVPPIPPGVRLVMHVFGVIPGQVGSAFVGGNQVWLQL